MVGSPGNQDLSCEADSDVPSSNSAPTQPKNATEKLRELNALFKEGLINNTKYEARMRAMLDAM
jgi:hypothetical protein